jgi:uncharacterized membrane protein SpoIIM required for sporulation
MAVAPVLKSNEFRREREAIWGELEYLLKRVDNDGIKSLQAHELNRLPSLYQATVSSLSVARAISLDVNLIEYLESLSARAYLCVYGTRRRLGEALVEFFTRTFPRSVRAAKWSIALAAAFMLVGAIAGFAMTSADPDRFYTFVPADYAQERGPSSTTESLEEVLYSDGNAADALAAFATSLFTHNAKIGIMAFALGFAFGVPVFFLMFYNGLILGAFAGLYHGRGLGVDFWGWVLPHGVTELLAVILCGGAGLVLARSVVFPGTYTRMQNLARRGREAGAVVLGAVFMFLIAGLIEGLFRQTVQNIGVRYGVVVLTAAMLFVYFRYAGRDPEDSA